MIVIISPAKTLNLAPSVVKVKTTKPKFYQEAQELNQLLAGYPIAKLKKLMSISDKLATDVESYIGDFSKDKLQKAAIMMYQGDVYQAFDFTTYTKKQLENLNQKVRIISGMYGLLRPFDQVEPYRLEMKTKLNNAKGSDLYDFWSDKLAKELDKSAKAVKANYIIDLASNEYRKAISEKLETPVVKIDFKDYKNSEYKTIGILAKRARGEMTDFIVKESVNSLDMLKKFSRDGYKFSAKLSTEKTNKLELVFTRKK